MKIVTDSAADLTPDEASAIGIRLAPLFIQFPEGEVSSLDLTPDQFYDRLQAIYPAIPSTALPSSGIFADLYRQAAAEDKQILSVHISLGLSGTANSARIAAEQMGSEAEVHVWDSMTLAGAERFQVLAAAMAARAGWTLDAIRQRLADIRANTELLFTLETLEYLVKGGRIGRVQALAGTLLNIKPVIHVDHADGKYDTVGKARSLPKCLNLIANHLHHLYGTRPVWVTVQHGRFAAQADALSVELRQRLNVAKLEIRRVSPVLGVHTGPGIVGVGVVPMSLMDGLMPTT